MKTETVSKTEASLVSKHIWLKTIENIVCSEVILEWTLGSAESKAAFLIFFYMPSGHD